jgi:hypothetical protein
MNSTWSGHALEPYNLRCNICSKHFSTLGEFNKHVITEHLIPSINANSSESNIQKGMFSILIEKYNHLDTRIVGIIKDMETFHPTTTNKKITLKTILDSIKLLNERNIDMSLAYNNMQDRVLKLEKTAHSHTIISTRITDIVEEMVLLKRNTTLATVEAANKAAKKSLIYARTFELISIVIIACVPLMYLCSLK